MLNLEDLEDFSEDLEILLAMLHGLVGYFATFCTIFAISYDAKQNSCLTFIKKLQNYNFAETFNFYFENNLQPKYKIGCFFH